jgi:hypothetical protein
VWVCKHSCTDKLQLSAEEIAECSNICEVEKKASLYCCTGNSNDEERVIRVSTGLVV